MISRKKIGHRNQQLEQRFAQKLLKFANIHIYNAVIQMLVNISTSLFEKAYLGTMIYSQKNTS